MDKLYKIHRYFENTKINLYWVGICVFASVSEVILLDYFFPFPLEEKFYVGLAFGIWALNIYVWRRLLNLREERLK